MTSPGASKRRLRIALISAKGPLYRRRGGLFRQSLRYMPLTLPTLAALIPDDINADVVCIDEGIADVDLNLQADLIGMTVITGTANRTYELSRHFRDHGITVILGGPHVTLVPDDAQPHADSIVVGYAEPEWPRLFRDFVAGELRPRYNQSPDLDLSGCPTRIGVCCLDTDTSRPTSSKRRAGARTTVRSASCPPRGDASRCRNPWQKSSMTYSGNEHDEPSLLT
ncbi:MAG: cobalamin-dependent protein [Fuerstiella sp.]